MGYGRLFPEVTAQYLNQTPEAIAEMRLDILPSLIKKI